jgi:hypothetical protein
LNRKGTVTKEAHWRGSLSLQWTISHVFSVDSGIQAEHAGLDLGMLAFFDLEVRVGGDAAHSDF